MPIERHAPGACPSLLTLDDVATLLRVSKTTVYRLVERRELPFCRVGRSLRFTAQDIDEYLRTRRVGSIASTLDRYERTQDSGALVR